MFSTSRDPTQVIQYNLVCSMSISQWNWTLQTNWLETESSTKKFACGVNVVLGQCQKWCYLSMPWHHFSVFILITVVLWLKNVYSVYIHEMGNAQLFCIPATNIFLYQIKMFYLNSSWVTDKNIGHYDYVYVKIYCIRLALYIPPDTCCDNVGIKIKPYSI